MSPCWKVSRKAATASIIVLKVGMTTGLGVDLKIIHSPTRNSTVDVEVTGLREPEAVELRHGHAHNKARSPSIRADNSSKQR